MPRHAGIVRVAGALCANPQMLRAKPSLLLFLCRYLRKFRVIDVDGHLILHSHLPPINSAAYKRFINEHLLLRTPRYSHAQVGVTNACPQRCAYCYNKDRRGTPMDTPTILATIRTLKESGVFWIGLTGGEPLLNKDLSRIVDAIGPDCASKLFTTGVGLTRERSAELKRAGLVYATVSLDDWREEEHDRIRQYTGAYRAALRAIDLFKSTGVHVSVSAVLSRSMLKERRVEEFLGFLRRLDVHEAWLSEAKPSVQAYWDKELVITEQERMELIALQDRMNRDGGMTINYLSHFEDASHFGCTAGHKMIYVDAFGEVSPCVFIPMSFGNVRHKPLADILAGMQRRFPSERSCFINRNYETIRRHFKGTAPIGEEESLRILDETGFGPLARFFQLQYH